MAVLKKAITWIILFVVAISYPFVFPQSEIATSLGNGFFIFIFKVLLGLSLFVTATLVQVYASWQFGFHKAANIGYSSKIQPKVRKNVASNLVALMGSALFLAFTCHLFLGGFHNSLPLLVVAVVMGYLDYKYFLATLVKDAIRDEINS